MAEKSRISSQNSHDLQRLLGKRRLFYVCRDAERAEAGLLWDVKNYRIIANTGRGLPKDTHELLASPIARKQIRRGNYVIVFKPTRQIETLCAQNGWRLLNPPSQLAARVEEKISQVEWLGRLAKLLPPHKIQILKNVKFSSAPFILQFNHAHTGSGTHLIRSRAELVALQNKFPERPARVTKYVTGPIFTANIIVWGQKILTGNISYQITGLSPFTDNTFATVGNDWALPHKILSPAQKKQFAAIAGSVGKKMAKDGWSGLFGIDVVADRKSKKLYLVEINARQPASASCESRLQYAVAKSNTLSTFTAHALALLGAPHRGEKLTPITDGAQIILRHQVKRKKINRAALRDFRLIDYPCTSIGSDCLRIQSMVGIMASDGKFNKVGASIVKTIK